VSDSYRIPDEPRPGALAHLTVNPSWPLLAMMLGGGWIGLPWFILNGAAMGSPRFRRETIIAALTPFVVVTVAFALFALFELFHLPKRATAYAVVALVAIKLAAGYYLFHAQLRTFGIYQHFGGRVRHGATIALASAMLRFYVVPAAFAVSPWLGILVM
jgi:hypothetical protein